MSDNLKSALLSAKEEINRLKEEVQKKVRAVFMQGTKELFEAHPDLESFAWPQYTPYFNDGDTCVFRASNDEPYINGINDYGDSLDGDHEQEDSERLWTYGKGYKRIWTEEGEKWHKLETAVKEFLQTFDDDDLLFMFNDHVSVHVTRDGVETEEYSHE